LIELHLITVTQLEIVLASNEAHAIVGVGGAQKTGREDRERYPRSHQNLGNEANGRAINGKVTLQPNGRQISCRP
jgi:hypothetical protein